MCIMNTIVNVRIEKKIKVAANKTLSGLGYVFNPPFKTF